ncbi:hypothetical protein C8R45DRAFT_995095 [Mycena sanguinolenta]|nr:hypothetical protein C8R45DRAFT_995095 [Mycena sanguinolenta]
MRSKTISLFGSILFLHTVMSHQEKGKQRETIEIEDDDARLERIQRVLEKLNTASPATGRDLESLLNIGSASVPGPGILDQTSSNELLARVQAFLPQLQASNAALIGQDPRALDIENIEGNEKVIQMSLGLGIFEDRAGREGTRSESESDEESSSEDENENAIEKDSDESSTTDSGSSDESSSSEESSSFESDDSSVPKQGRKIAPLPKRALLARAIRPLPAKTGRPEIVVLAETTTED